MAPDLTDQETATLLRELDQIIDGDRFQLPARIRNLTAIRESYGHRPVRQPLPPENDELPRRRRRR